MENRSITNNNCNSKDFKNLITAVKNNDSDSLTHVLVNNDCKIDLVDSKCGRNSPLHVAIASGYDDIVKILVKHGADINGKTHWGEQTRGTFCGILTPLQVAVVVTENESMVRTILEEGADCRYISTILDQAVDLYVRTDDNDTQKVWLAKCAILLSAGCRFSSELDFFLKVKVEHKLIRNDKWWFIEMLWLSGHKFTRQLAGDKLTKLPPNPFEGYGLLEAFNREPLPLKAFAANVVRLSLKPNVFVGIKHLQLPNELSKLIFIK